MNSAIRICSLLLPCLPLLAQVTPPGPGTADIELPLVSPHGDAFHLIGGYSAIPGTFGGITWSTDNLLNLGETLNVTGQIGDRTRGGQITITKPYAADSPWTTGITFFGQRFRYLENREASLTAFDRDIPQVSALGPMNIANYISVDVGGTLFATRPFGGGRSHLTLAYGYDVSSYAPGSAATLDFFQHYHYLNGNDTNRLSGIKTSKVTASWTYNTLDNPANPAKGRFLSMHASMAGLGGDVSFFKPGIEAKYYLRGFRKRHVIAMRIRGELVTGYGGESPPPSERFYMGGEDEVRGYNSGAVSPVFELPDMVPVPDLNEDGSPRTQRVSVNGVLVSEPVTIPVQIYRLFSPGGDVKMLANFEYRIPLVKPLTLVLFADAGQNRATFASQLRFNSPYIDRVNYGYLGPFSSALPEATPLTSYQRIRMSTGIELQARIPHIGTPVRFYWAWNPLAIQQYVVTPLVIDESTLPNGTTFENAVNTYARYYFTSEHSNTFRISIGRTF